MVSRPWCCRRAPLRGGGAKVTLSRFASRFARSTNTQLTRALCLNSVQVHTHYRLPNVHAGLPALVPKVSLRHARKYNICRCVVGRPQRPASARRAVHSSSSRRRWATSGGRVAHRAHTEQASNEPNPSIITRPPATAGGILQEPNSSAHGSNHCSESCSLGANTHCCWAVSKTCLVPQRRRSAMTRGKLTP